MNVKNLIIIAVILILFFVSNSINAQIQPPEEAIYSLKESKTSMFVEGKTKITKITFVGLDSDYEQYDFASEKRLPESGVKKALEDNRLLNEANSVFDTGEIEKAIRIINEWLAAKGYLKADIVVSRKLLPKNEMELIFSIERNSPVEITEVQFIGNKHISNQEFVTDYKNCIGESWRKFNRKLYQYITGKCSQQLMLNKGFLRGKINRIRPRFVNDNYTLEIEIEEGVRYRVGEINIKDAKEFSQEEILKMSGINLREIANATKIREFFLKDLENKYADKGFIEYSVNLDMNYVEPLAEGLDGTLNLLVSVDEGASFRIGEIDFIGVEKEDEQKLKDMFTLKEGEIYNRSKLEESVEKINKLKAFDPIDFDRDIETQPFTRSNKSNKSERPNLKREKSGNLNLSAKNEVLFGDVYLVIKVKKAELR